VIQDKINSKLSKYTVLSDGVAVLRIISSDCDDEPTQLTLITPQNCIKAETIGSVRSEWIKSFVSQDTYRTKLTDSDKNRVLDMIELYSETLGHGATPDEIIKYEKE